MAVLYRRRLLLLLLLLHNLLPIRATPAETIPIPTPTTQHTKQRLDTLGGPAPTVLITMSHTNATDPVPERELENTSPPLEARQLLEWRQHQHARNRDMEDYERTTRDRSEAEEQQRAWYARCCGVLEGDERIRRYDKECSDIFESSGSGTAGAACGKYNESLEIWLKSREAKAALNGRPLTDIIWLFTAPGQPRPADLGHNFVERLEDISQTEFKMVLYHLSQWTGRAIRRWKLTNQDAADVMVGLDKILQPKFSMSKATNAELTESLGRGQIPFWPELLLKLHYGYITPAQLSEWEEHRATYLKGYYSGASLAVKLSELENYVRGWSGVLEWKNRSRGTFDIPETPEIYYQKAGWKEPKGDGS
ncbi:hypothetical protein PVAG01_06143 [Phlyctema vagabunda]|uniref:Uncharacterized protein n=1 Tax=Phlyctema vagabunda TaxID=108571 RepID=A0ABR4PFV8_9HELO